MLNRLSFPSLMRQSRLIAQSNRLFANRNATNPVVFMDFTRNGQDIGKISFEVSLFSNTNIWFSFMQITLPKRQKTSDPCAVVTAKKDTTTRAVPSTESLMASWPKVVISLEEMVLVAFPSMATNSLMRTSKLSTHSVACFQWQTQAKTPMEVNSSLLSALLTGSTGLMLSSVK
jgi:hypothetical protein